MSLSLGIRSVNGTSGSGWQLLIHWRLVVQSRETQRSARWLGDIRPKAGTSTHLHSLCKSDGIHPDGLCPALGDYWCDFPLVCWHLCMPPEARIYEVDGPESWHNLCVQYPTRARDDDRLVPNWGAAAEDWDGIHLSFGGLLTCEQVRHESPAGWSKHEFWHAELTHWINRLPFNAQRLPDHDGRESSIHPHDHTAPQAEDPNLPGP